MSKAIRRMYKKGHSCDPLFIIHGVQVTALWVTHRLEEIGWADSVSYMDEGRIQFTGSPQEATRYLRRLGAPVREPGLHR